MTSNASWVNTLVGTTIGTFSGLRVDPRALEPCMINIKDIAHSLSMQCRFGGHCKEFYSVAQHSLEVSRHVPEEYALCGLLHDAAEAYLTDLPKPIKALFPDYQALELEIQEKVAVRFGLPWPIPEEVHIADSIELITEAAFFHQVPIYDYDLKPRKANLISLAPGFAEYQFMQRFNELTF